MKSWQTSAICILLVFLCLFSSVGFASLSDSTKILGRAKVNIPYGLFITSVTTKSTTTVDHESHSFLDYSTTLDSTIDRARGNNTTGTVVYTVTVLNNTKLTYSYRKIYYQSPLDDYNGNRYVSTSANRSRIGVVCSLEKLSAADKKIAPGESKTFTVTYTVGSGMDAGTDWRTLINFQFGINVDGEREALEVIEAKFLNILNTTSTYEQLIDALDNKFDGYQEWTSNYIGNVKGSSSEDSVAVNTLFAGQLQIMVGQNQMDATVLIKHENLDWNNYTGDDYTAIHPTNGGVFNGYGCEMTLYLTIDPLEKAGAYVPVYAVVFTCNRDNNGNQTSDWYRIGSTYAGTANVVTYDGNTGTGSFVTDNWIADAATYKLIDGYSYTINGETYRLNSYSHSVAQGTSIKDIVIATDTNAINRLQDLLNDANKIINDQKFAGVGIDLVQEAYLKYSGLYTVNPDGTHTVDPNATIAQVSPAIVDLYKVVNSTLSEMDKLSKQQ